MIDPEGFSNNGFMSDFSDAVSLTLPQTVPLKPIMTRLVAADGQIIIYLSDGHQPTTIDVYTATCTDGINTYVGSSSGTTITVDGLVNGQEYSCWVSAENEAGTSKRYKARELCYSIASFGHVERSRIEHACVIS